MDKINSDNFVEMNAYTLEHRILVTGNTKANWEFFIPFSPLFYSFPTDRPGAGRVPRPGGPPET